MESKQMEGVAGRTYSYGHFLRALLLTLLIAPLLASQLAGSRVEYVGGTLSEFQKKTKGRVLTTDPQFLYFRTKRVTIRVPYEHINLLEYGLQVKRRVGLAILVSPLLMFTKSRKHFLTVGYVDDDGNQQVMVFQVHKDDIRPLLVSLEARTGLEVQYQDEEARRAGKGG